MPNNKGPKHMEQKLSDSSTIIIGNFNTLSVIDRIRDNRRLKHSQDIWSNQYGDQICNKTTGKYTCSSSAHGTSLRQNIY